MKRTVITAALLSAFIAMPAFAQQGPGMGGGMMGGGEMMGGGMMDLGLARSAGILGNCPMGRSA